MLGGRELPQYAPIIGAEFVSPSYNVNESYLEFRFHLKLEICLRSYAPKKLIVTLRNYSNKQFKLIPKRQFSKMETALFVSSKLTFSNFSWFLSFLLMEQNELKREISFVVIS